MSDLPERDDAEALIAPRIERWENAPWEDLDRLEANEVDEQAVGPSGQCYRVRSYAFWDTEPWESELYVWVKVYGNRGWRKWWPYRGSLSRRRPERDRRTGRRSHSGRRPGLSVGETGRTLGLRD